MESQYPNCAIGTMAWGKSVYGKIIQGNAVTEEQLKSTLDTAKKNSMLLIDTAYKYGMGCAERLIGKYADSDFIISTKFTPSNRYGTGEVSRKLDRDLQTLHRDYVDIYWLHLPIKIEQNILEIADLVQQGKVKHVGVSNFNLEEIKKAQEILSGCHISLYGVQNHYSLISRDWEENGVLDWCKNNHVKFYAWSVMEQGALSGKMHFNTFSIRGRLYNKKVKKMETLFKVMAETGDKYGLSIAQVSIAWAVSKGVIPICGCRKPYQVEELEKASKIHFTAAEICGLEGAAASSGQHTAGDMFRKTLSIM